MMDWPSFFLGVVAGLVIVAVVIEIRLRLR